MDLAESILANQAYDLYTLSGYVLNLRVAYDNFEYIQPRSDNLINKVHFQIRVLSRTGVDRVIQKARWLLTYLPSDSGLPH